MLRTDADSFLQRVVTTVAQGVVAQAASHGIASIPEGFAGEVMLRAVARIKAMPGDQLRDISMANHSFAQTVATSFETAFSDLPRAERLALRGMPDPDRAGGIAGNASPGGQWVNGQWVLGAYRGMAAAAAASGRDGTASYRDLPGTTNSFGPEKYTYTQMADLARDLHVGWAVNVPDLMKLGPTALQAIGEAHMQRVTYLHFAKEDKLGAKTVVGIARLAKARGFDVNEFAREGDRVITENSSSAQDAKDTRVKMGVLGDVLHNTASTPEQRATAEDAVRGKFTAMRARHPEHAAQIDRLQHQLGISTEANEAAQSHTARRVAAAETRVAAAETREANADAKADLFMKPKPKFAPGSHV